LKDSDNRTTGWIYPDATFHKVIEEVEEHLMQREFSNEIFMPACSTD